MYTNNCNQPQKYM